MLTWPDSEAHRAKAGALPGVAAQVATLEHMALHSPVKQSVIAVEGTEVAKATMKKTVVVAVETLQQLLASLASQPALVAIV